MSSENYEVETSSSESEVETYSRIRSNVNTLRPYDFEPDATTRSMRYAAYRQFTWWVHNRLGGGVRKVIPSCAIWAIRDTYPKISNNYVPFQESRDEINA